MLACMALLFVQNLPLHAHGLHHHQDSAGQAALHEHFADIHVGEFAEQDIDHSSVATIDLSAVAVMKKISADSLFVAILMFCFLLRVPVQAGQVFWSVFPPTNVSANNFVLRPPLLAPPL